MTEEEKFQYKITILGNIVFLGFTPIHFHIWGEPMLMGGTEYYARKGNYLLGYDIKHHTVRLQETEDNFFENDKPFVFEFEPFDNCKDKLRLVRPSKQN